MENEFDPYHKWLGIPPREQPADHYRLLGIERFEEDADVISLAGDQRMHFLRSFQNGERAKISQKLLNEVAAARVCLLDTEKKTEYDDSLRQKLEDEKQSADPASEDIAATLEFATPDSTVDWPVGADDESNSSNLWNAHQEQSNSEIFAPPSSLTRKTKIRVLILSTLSGTALLLLLGVGLAGFSESKKQTAKSDRQQSVTGNPSPASPDGETEGTATENESKQAAAKAEAARQAEEAKKREAEAKADAARQAKEAAAKKEKEEADRRAEEEKRKAEQQARLAEIQRRVESLQQRVDQSIQKAERMQYSPDQALDVIRDTLAEVERAEVPFRFKRALRQKLKGVGSEVSRRLADQREKQAAEEKAAWRREHPEEYLESLGLVKQKDAWELEAAVELSELNKPLTKLISRYNRESSEIKTKKIRVNKQENRIVAVLQKLPGFFRDPDFQRWILDGMQEYPDAPRRVRAWVDNAREDYERFRERFPRPANEVQQKVGQLHALKRKYQEDVDSLNELVDEISDIDQAAERLMRDIEQAEENLNRENADVQAALISSDSKYDPPDMTSTQKLLKKVGEILEDDLVGALRERRESRFQN